jgi:hypothetical protein
MPKPAAVAIPLFEGDDEDSLVREDHGEQEDGGIAEEVIVSLVRTLSDAGPAGVHLLNKLIGSLEDMGDAVMAKDHAGLEDAADDAHEVLAKLLDE